MCVHCTGGLLSRRVSSQPADANLNAHANVANAEPSWQVNPPPPPLPRPLPSTLLSNMMIICIYRLPVREDSVGKLEHKLRDYIASSYKSDCL